MLAQTTDRIYKAGYTIESLSENTLYLKIDGTSKIDLKEAQEIKKLALKILGGQPFKNMVDFGNNSGVLTTEAKRFIASDPDLQKLKICDALITNSLTTTILIGAYIRLFNPVTPIKTFDNLTDAKAWVEIF